MPLKWVHEQVLVMLLVSRVGPSWSSSGPVLHNREDTCERGLNPSHQ